ncbi:MAG: hypothetical protein JNK02_17375 [Planctomycetes bacterium]|nr:hypothetical protein [Planctomycetota bacterium]
MKIHGHNPVSGAKPVNPIQSAARQGLAREKSPAAAGPARAEAPAQEPTGHARLDAFAGKLAQRFEAALSAQDLSPRQRLALEEQRDAFRSMISRFQDAYLSGAEAGKKDAAEGMQKLLAQFGKNVSHILAGGTTTGPGPTTPGTTDSSVIPAAGGGRTGGLDVVG